MSIESGGREPMRTARDMLKDELQMAQDSLKHWQTFQEQKDADFTKRALEVCQRAIEHLDVYIDRNSLIPEERDWAIEEREMLLARLTRCGWRPSVDPNLQLPAFDSWTRPRTN